MIKVDPNRRSEWPIVKFWYTKHKGKTIEELIDKNVDFFEWVVSTFQNITMEQAIYYHKKTGNKVPLSVIQDVTPYEHQPKDPDQMYMELCDTQDYDMVMRKYRGVSLELF